MIKNSRAMVMAAIGLWAVLTFAHAMNRPVEPNEQMYIPAAVLSQEAWLYRDFTFLQMPYLPLLYAAFYSWSGAGSYLLIARLLTWMATMATLLVTGFTAWRLSRHADIRLGVLAASLLGCSECFILVSGECSNYIYAMLFASLAFASLTCWSGWLGAFLAGWCLSVAIGFKLYYLTLLPVLCLGWWLAAKVSSASWRGWWAMIGGLGLGLLPAVSLGCWFPEAFLFNNLTAHFESAEWYTSLAYADRMTIFQKLRYLKSNLQHPSQVWCVVGAMGWWMSWRWQRAARESRLAAVFGGATIVAACTALTPTPMWPQYVAMLLPFAVWTWVVVGDRRAPRAASFLLGTMVAVGVLVSGPYYLRQLVKLAKPDQWPGVAMRRDAQRLLERAPWLRQHLVVSLTPILPMEAGLKIDRAFSASRFVYQTADRLTDEVIDHAHVTSPQRLARYLDTRPGPLAIITQRARWSIPGAAPGEDDLDRYAAERGYACTEYEDLGLRVWRQPR
jgi:hypothetical protein